MKSKRIYWDMEVAQIILTVALFLIILGWSVYGYQLG